MSLLTFVGLRLLGRGISRSSIPGLKVELSLGKQQKVIQSIGLSLGESFPILSLDLTEGLRASRLRLRKRSS